MRSRTAGILVIVCAAAIAAAFVVLRDGSESGPNPASPQVRGEPPLRIPVMLDARRQQFAGVRVERVERGTLKPLIPAVGVVSYDRTRLTDVSMRVEGWIRDVYVYATGATVPKGQQLLSLDSPELISLQTQLLAALRNRDLVTPEAAREQPQYTERLVDTPRERLLRAEVPEDQLRILEERRQILPAVVFRSPVRGVVIESSVVKGMHVDAGATLYRLADLSVLWLEAEYPESDLPSLRLGANASARVAAWPGKEFPGRVISLSPSLKESGRTVTARIELANPDARLKPGMIGSVSLSVGERDGLMVSEDAVVDSGTRQIVFVAKPHGYYEPREVTLGGRANGRVLILTGLQENEDVVRRGAFLIDSESQMRAALQNYEEASTVAQVPQPDDSLEITLQTRPDPPKTGKNAVEVRIRDRAGHPVTALDVRLLCYMPAMPSMNMPEMRSDTRLNHVKDGIYAGVISIAMTGRWTVTVTASREGRTIATTNTSMAAQ